MENIVAKIHSPRVGLALCLPARAANDRQTQSPPHNFCLLRLRHLFPAGTSLAHGLFFSPTDNWAPPVKLSFLHG
jgi:hypothetical protein